MSSEVDDHNNYDDDNADYWWQHTDQAGRSRRREEQSQRQPRWQLPGKPNCNNELSLWSQLWTNGWRDSKLAKRITKSVNSNKGFNSIQRTEQKTDLTNSRSMSAQEQGLDGTSRCSLWETLASISTQPITTKYQQQAALFAKFGQFPAYAWFLYITSANIKYYQFFSLILSTNTTYLLW